MAGTRSASRSRKAGQESERIVHDLFQRLAAADGQPSYEPEAIAASAALAHDALCRHRKGHAVVSLDRSDSLVQAGRPVTAITVINDNMPFLFDSVMGEINDTCGELLFVVHPVLEVSFKAKDICEIHGVAKRRNPEGDRDLVSENVRPLPQLVAQDVDHLVEGAIGGFVCRRHMAVHPVAQRRLACQRSSTAGISASRNA